jgi:predicted phage terminase large subunit-like protein
MQTLEALQLESLADDVELRRAAAKTLKGFCATYLAHHFPQTPSDFFDEMACSLQDHNTKRLEIIGFRGCAKSTMASLALILWAALEHPNKYPFIIMLADTRGQASINAASVQHELRNNELILKDYGHLKYKSINDPRPEPTLESDEDWQAMNCVLDNGVRILSRSRGQKIRGIKHRQHRPSLIVADDVEDLDWVRTQENRDKSDRWFRGNVLPSIDEQHGRAVLIGNWLHTDGLMARLKNTGIFTVLEFPLLREDVGKNETEIERCTWKAKYPTQEAIDLKRQELGDIGFRREMLLQVVPEEGQDVLPEDIHYYDEPPFDDGNHLAHGVDLAISTKESADYTAIVSGEVAWEGGKTQLYIQPNPIIRHMTFAQTMDALDNVRRSTSMSCEFFVEAVAYQQAAIEEMERRAFSVQAMHPIKDKRARLRVAARYIKLGVVKFPRTGCEQLMTQLLGFGAEKHDDAVDALVYLILGVIGDGIEEQKVHYV